MENSQPQPDAGGEAFVSVLQAAQTLGISERQARRRSAKLTESDRTTTDTGALRVRLSALAEPGELSRAAPLSDAERPDTRPVNATADPDTPTGHQTDIGESDRTDTTDANAALLDQLRRENESLRGENARVWDALTREQESVRAALASLEQERQRSAVLIAAAATGRLTGHDTERPDGHSEGRPDTDRTQSGNVTSERDSTGDTIAPGTISREAVTEGQKPGFWARLFGRKG